MPGLLSHHLRDADALHFCPIQFPLPSRIPSTRSTDFRRMPLHHLTTVRYDVNETTLDLPEEPRINQHNNHLLINHNDQVHNKDNYRFASEFPSNLHGSAEAKMTWQPWYMISWRMEVTDQIFQRAVMVRMASLMDLSFLRLFRYLVCFFMQKRQKRNVLYLLECYIE